MMNVMVHSDYIVHHGVKGQRWGVRRYQNEDGSLTSRGRQRRELTPEQKEKRKKIAKGVAIGAGATAVTIGASYLAMRGYAAKVLGEVNANVHNAGIASKQKSIMRNAHYWDEGGGLIGLINRNSQSYKAGKNIAAVQIGELEKQKTTVGKEFAKLFFSRDLKVFG